MREQLRRERHSGAVCMVMLRVIEKAGTEGVNGKQADMTSTTPTLSQCLRTHYDEPVSETLHQQLSIWCSLKSKLQKKNKLELRRLLHVCGVFLKSGIAMEV